MSNNGEEALYDIYRKHPRVCTDSRKVSPGDLFVGLAGTQVQGNKYAAAALEAGAAFAIVDDPSVVKKGDERYLLVPDSLVALQNLATEHRRRHQMPVLAITGSNGKTTTKELINAVMSRRYAVHATPGNFNNHLGLPLTVLSTPEDTEMTILEMGANHQGEIAELCRIGRPTHGLITNIGDAHLEGFGGREGVIAGKGELFTWLASNRGVAFVNADEPYLMDMAAGLDRIIRYFESETPSKEVPGMETKVYSISPRIEVGFLDEHGQILRCTVALSGKHNLQNVKSAIAVGKYFKIPCAEIQASLEAFRPSNYRSQELEHRGVSFYWDAYNANPSSVEAALMAFNRAYEPTNAVVVLGEMLELGASAPAAHRRAALRAGQAAGTVLLTGAAMKEAAEEFELRWFEDSAALNEWFWKQDWSGKTVFVKGSRGNKLELLLE
ncbi:UDP-N-acetylmuramoyl-tripeptide--D-alanyl-D-alanine ligase [Neolewinella aurantiaca]|uniref:UDP-N-acetylmuramoyl-tripeptide--D-alanyl-D-alanine ligase n=1 Tax=Neolewinella aurantiaca TaxID=2602767 RepID=A0A5C7FJV5_9BACT|nr:UDP-N-acetylmuramoyl-tripeptide--D-alanyl-D-alanine ligase [Neolewinella aurantiaca]TXF90934.1 UDP-N-acetylmuramoyl-tripeptide--D-alanyl-D-alanine ligase [Neolewinella aurantiaca]